MINKTMMGLTIDGISELRKYRVIPVLLIMRLKFRDIWWLFKVTHLCYCLRKVKEL